MSTKAEVMGKVNPTTNYTGSRVRQFLNEVTTEDALKPNKLRRGDVIITPSGVKKRPCVVIRVTKGIVIGIPLTSSENFHALCPSCSRFFGDSWFANQYVTMTPDFALNNFCGVYDNPRCLKNAIRELKEFTNRNIK